MIKFPKFQIFEGRDNQYYFRLSAVNGETLLGSEGYKSKQGAVSGITSVKKNAKEEKFELRVAENDQHYFVLKAGNGQIIGQSETYASLRSAENGTNAVIKIAKDALVEDTTIEANTYSNPKYEIFKGDDEQFYFRLNARNGENILSSEGYSSKYAAKKGILSVRNNASKENFEERESEDGQYYFVLKADNGEIIGMSEMYISDASRDAGVRAVLRVAEDAPLEDTTINTIIEIETGEYENDSTGITA